MSAITFWYNPSMTNRLDDIQLAAWRNLITFHAQAIEAIDRSLIAANCIPLHWYDVLIELYETPERRMRMYELANKVVLSRSGLTRLVDRLEEAALITRQTDPADRRGFYVQITDEGVAALRTAWPVYARAIQNNFAQFISEDEAGNLADIFDRMIRREPEQRQASGANDDS